jgi:hypothetical protein
VDSLRQRSGGDSIVRPQRGSVYRYTNEENGLVLRRYWTNACQSCAIKQSCTTGKEQRTAGGSMRTFLRQFSVANDPSRIIADSRRTACRETEMSDLSQHKVAMLRPLSLPAWLALAAFPGPPGTPFALRRAIVREEREKKHPACARLSLAIATSRGTGEATDWEQCREERRPATGKSSAPAAHA